MEATETPLWASHLSTDRRPSASQTFRQRNAVNKRCARRVDRSPRWRAPNNAAKTSVWNLSESKWRKRSPTCLTRFGKTWLTRTIQNRKSNWLCLFAAWIQNMIGSNDGELCPDCNPKNMTHVQTPGVCSNIRVNNGSWPVPKNIGIRRYSTPWVQLTPNRQEIPSRRYLAPARMDGRMCSTQRSYWNMVVSETGCTHLMANDLSELEELFFRQTHIMNYLCPRTSKFQVPMIRHHGVPARKNDNEPLIQTIRINKVGHWSYPAKKQSLV